MKKPHSLKIRFSILISVSTGFILIVSALFVFYGAQQHFIDMDKHTLSSKSNIVNTLTNDFMVIDEITHNKLNVFLSRHPDMSLVTTDLKGNVLRGGSDLSINFIELIANKNGEFFTSEDNNRLYMGTQLTTKHTHHAFLLLDTSHHQVFYSWLSSLFALTIIISTFISFILGWFITNHGLNPLTKLAAIFKSVNAESLKEALSSNEFEPELKPLVNSFNKMLERLDEAFQQLENFSSDIAHELRTPISNLITQTGVILLKDRTKDEYIELAYSNLEEFNLLSKMIADMLFLAKNDHNQLKVSSSNIIVRNEINALLEYFEMLAEEKEMGITLSGNLQIIGEPQMFKRAISNLISNAINYGRVGSEIQITLFENETTKSIEISNEGDTLSKSEQVRVFDRFYQTDPARNRGSGANVGLGLAITRAIILAHQGNISCSSDNGITTMTITLPIVPI